MSWWWLKCADTCRFVLAELCPDQDDPEDAPTVYVAREDLPTAPIIFRHDQWCYTVDPADAMTFLPKSAVRVAPMIDDEYEDCAECVEDEGDSGTSGGGGGEPGPGATVGKGDAFPPPGPWGGEPAPECWIAATPCAGHEGGPAVYVPCNHLPPGTSIFRYRGRCYSASASGTQVETLPEGAHVVWVSGSYVNCAACTDGVQAEICPDQEELPGYDDLPEIWVSTLDLPAMTVYFDYAGFCFKLDPTDTPDTITPLALLLTPPDRYSSCAACLTGVQAVICPDQPNMHLAPEVWVETDELPEIAVTFNVKGWCHTIDPETTPVRIPTDALVIVPTDAYADCAACICGPGDDEALCGYLAVPCGFQAGAPEGLWVRCDHVEDERVFLLRGFCYHVGPSCHRGLIPKGAIVVNPMATHLTCGDCITDGLPNGNGWPLPDGNQPPGPPFQQPPEAPPTKKAWRQLRRCYENKVVDGQLVAGKLRNLWIATDALDNLGNPVNVGDVVTGVNSGYCYEVTANQEWDRAGLQKVMHALKKAEDCEECSIVELRKCGGGGTTARVTAATFHASGPVLKLDDVPSNDDGTCYKFLRLSDLHGTVGTFVEGYINCAVCEDHLCCPSGVCCISNHSVLTLTSKPTLTYSGADTDVDAAITAYNGASNTIPFYLCAGGEAQWQRNVPYTDSGGAKTLSIRVRTSVSGSNRFHAQIISPVLTNENTSDQINMGGNATCCGFTGVTATTSHADMTISGTWAGTISNNKCCGCDVFGIPSCITSDKDYCPGDADNECDQFTDNELACDDAGGA